MAKAKMWMGSEAMQVWEGIEAIDATLHHDVEQIDVTAMGDTHAHYVPGLSHEWAEVNIRCNKSAYELLLAALRTPVTLDPVSDSLVVRIPTTLRANCAMPSVPPTMEEAPVRLIRLEK